MTTFSQVLIQAYREVPDKAAVYLQRSSKGDQTITYQSLVDGAMGYTQALARAGTLTGDVVILILDHGDALLQGYFGAILHGAIPSIMPFLTEKLSPEHYRKSLESLFEIVQPGAVITSEAFAGEVARASSLWKPHSIILSEQVSPVTEIDLSGLPGLRREPEDIALLQHSSGTTGLQKGVALSHTAVFNQLQSYSNALHLSGQDVIVSWLPLYHDMGLIAGFLLPILSRVPLVLMSPFDWVRAPQRLMQAVSDYKGTLSWLPNFAYNFCAQKIRGRHLDAVDLSSWRAVINCSEPMHWESHNMFLERFTPFGLRPTALATCYAMAETVFAVTQGGIGTPVKIDRVDGPALTTQQVAISAQESQSPIMMLSAGLPIENTSIRILDASGKEVSERLIGEIAIQSNSMLSGYHNRPDLTEKAFLDGWYLSGDLGYLADGELYITGRKKDLIIVGGKNIYPQDLERLASGVSGIHPGRIVAFGVYNPEMGTEEVIIVAESDEREQSRRDKIANQLREQVTRGSDVALRQVLVVDRDWLLKTSSGKIARSANREKFIQSITH